ncbi:MAG: transposase [Gracilimonas sp.]|nr:transposase [Gracilimonas sp.]
MQFLPAHTYHIYNQGNNRDQVFYDRSDYLLFLNKTRKAFLWHCNVLAWCLMPNHFHFLVQIKQDYEFEYSENDHTKKLNPLNRNIGSLLSSYTQILNTRKGRTGSLLRKRTKSKSLSEILTMAFIVFCTSIKIQSEPVW